MIELKVRPEPPYLVLCLNPTLQRSLVFDRFSLGAVNRAAQGRMDASGKGINVTRVLSQLGQESVHLTHIGGSGTEEFLSLSKKDRLSLTTVPGGSGIRVCTTVIDLEQSTTTELIEPALPVHARCSREIIEHFRTIVGRFRTLIFSGSVAPGYPEDIAAQLISMARQQGLFVIADFRASLLKRALKNPASEYPHIIKINFQELATTFFPSDNTISSENSSENGTNPHALKKAKDTIGNLLGAGIVAIITRGSQSTLCPSEDTGVHEIPVEKMNALNTIGCGDSFTAGLATALSTGSTIVNAIEQAHSTAARNAMILKPGTIEAD